MDFGLSREVVDRIVSVFKKFSEIDEVVVYGSRVKGNYKKGSDIDITLKGDKLNLKILNKISWELDDLLLPYSFDLSIYSHIDNTELIEHISRMGVIIYSKE